MVPTYPPPTEAEWAAADVRLIKFRTEAGQLLFGLRKDLLKNGVPYTQTVWLTPPQLRALAIDQVL